ncbi:MAG TPA: putative glycolipid-binding domain-containing protein [Pseudonocardiaceae bacterium]
MLTWQGAPDLRLESARVVSSGGLKLRASGRVIVPAQDDRAGYTADYELAVDDTGLVRRLLVSSMSLSHERQISLARSEDGNWLVDDGSGAQRRQFDGAVDVDVFGAALFNAIPIRRLGLHRETGERTLPVVFVSLPDLTTNLVQQTYRTVSLGEPTSVLEYRSGSFEAQFTVDADGHVLDYPGLAHR